jgi:hypothetical protein
MPKRNVDIQSAHNPILLSPELAYWVKTRMPAKRNVLLDGAEHHHAFAQAMGALCFPGGRTDAAPIWWTAVVAGPTDHAANVHAHTLLWKDWIVESNFRAHNVLSHVRTVRCKVYVNGNGPTDTE